ncbi:uracil-DNA glycosylase family protein [Bifidobacterium aquikefiricola]|uniref:Uracil-DNA glycosylase family protein n=1 Tax=Bifidobacterium aquikefiricola TaxID=3059038 RepID=A0AB39U8J4_9BIFI
MKPYEHVEHGFGPVWDEASQILMLGSMPSPKSRAAGFYYMHPRNRFWKVLEALYPACDGDAARTTDIASNQQAVAHNDGQLHSESIAVRQAFLHHHHIALWDVLESCDIRGASDASIRNPVVNDLAGIIQQSRIHAIYATGTRAAKLFDRFCSPALEVAGIQMPITALPSTSPANAAMSLDRLIEAYRCIVAVTEPTLETPGNALSVDCR